MDSVVLLLDTGADHIICLKPDPIFTLKNLDYEPYILRILTKKVLTKFYFKLI